MKRIFFLIITLFFLIINLTSFAFAEGEQIGVQIPSTKITSLSYDNSSSLVCISSMDSKIASPAKYVKLSNPNRIYFDIQNAVLIGGKQQLVFNNSPIKEIRLAQFETNPNIVRTVITFEEDFDTSKIKLLSSGGNIITKISDPNLSNDYFNLIYTDKAPKTEYSSISADSQFIQKVAVPIQKPENTSGNVMNDIQKAFGNSTLQNTDGKTYDSVVSVDISSKLKLRTKYCINQYIQKSNGLLVSGIGQVTTNKIFYLNSPKRAVIDLPNAYLDRSVRNKEISLCTDGSCNDMAKIGQFDTTTARIVITSENAEKYLPIYSQDSQSLFLINSDKLNHTNLSQYVSNINKGFVKKIDSKTSELILSFTSPIVHSIIKTENSLNIYLFNVKSYNEQDLIKTLNNTPYKQFTLSLLPQIGVRGTLQLNKGDIVKIEESIDAKALKITIERATTTEIKSNDRFFKRSPAKNKVVLDAGHGGSDYGAIREGINEKDITLDITRRVESLLKSKGYKVALTRSDDTYVSLEDRVAFSEAEEPEIFVSIHVNSAVSTDPNGIETHWYHDYSKPLAETIHKHFIKELPNAKDRGLFKSKFYVINHTTVPAVLCEIGFLSNIDERNELLTEERKQKTAKAIADGIIEYIGAGGKK